MLPYETEMYDNEFFYLFYFVFPLGIYATPMREIKESGNMGNQKIKNKGIHFLVAL